MLQTPIQRSSLAARGFTLPELCLGLLITSLVMGAVASFSLALANSWNAAQDGTSVQQTETRIVTRLREEFAGAKALGVCEAGDLPNAIVESVSPAAIVFWKADKNGDEKPQSSELELITHDRANKTLVRYTAQGVLATDSQWTFDELNAAAAIGRLQATLTPTVLSKNVLQAHFAVHHQRSDTCRPLFEYLLQIKNGDATGTEYGCFALRGPSGIAEN